MALPEAKATVGGDGEPRCWGAIMPGGDDSSAAAMRAALSAGAGTQLLQEIAPGAARPLTGALD